MSSPNVSLAPGADLTVSNEGNNGNFVMGTSEWVTLQRYVLAALSLPQDFDALKLRIGVLDPKDTEMKNAVVPLLDRYHLVHDHCEVWRNSTFPESVGLADDVVHYASKTEVYYKALLKPLNDLIDDETNESAKKRFIAICESLTNEAKTYADRAETVMMKIKKFQEETEQDQIKLEELKTGYEQTFGATSKDMQDMQEKLKTLKDQVNTLNKEYDHYVVVAATTVTYAWVPIYGWIAGGIVAGIYGDKAVKTLNAIHDINNQIEALDKTVARNLKFVELNQDAANDIGNLIPLLNAALPIIGKIRGCWATLSSDLDNIVNIIQQDIKLAIPILKDIGIEFALAEWAKVGNRADAYRLNAYIVQQPTSEAIASLQKNGVKV